MLAEIDEAFCDLFYISENTGKKHFSTIKVSYHTLFAVNPTTYNTHVLLIIHSKNVNRQLLALQWWPYYIIIEQWNPITGMKSKETVFLFVTYPQQCFI